MAVGDAVLGVRTNSRDIVARIEKLLPDHIHPEPSPHANYSIVMGDPQRLGDPIHFLTRANIGQLRTSSAGRLLRALLLQLSVFETWRSGETVTVNARVLIRETDAVIVHPGVISNIYTIERRLNRLGYHLLDAVGADIDVSRGELRLDPPRLAIDEEQLHVLYRDCPIQPNEVGVSEPRILPLRAWVLPADQLDATTFESPAATAVSLTRQLRRDRLPDPDVAVAAVHALVERTEIHLTERRNRRKEAEALLASL